MNNQNYNERRRQQERSFSDNRGFNGYRDEQEDSNRNDDYNRTTSDRYRSAQSGREGAEQVRNNPGGRGPNSQSGFNYGPEGDRYNRQDRRNQGRDERAQSNYQFEDFDNPSSERVGYAQQQNRYNPNYDQPYSRQQNTGYSQGRYTSEQYGQPHDGQTSYDERSSAPQMSEGYGQSYNSRSHGASYKSGSYIGQYGSPNSFNSQSPNYRQNQFNESHYGKGPKNYSRSDDRIKEDVCEALTHHAGIDATDVTVEVRSGEVTLTGSISDRSAKREVEDVAENCSGVKDVQNHLKVTSSSSTSSNSTSRDGSSSNGSSRDGSASSGSTNGSSSASNGSSSRSSENNSDKKSKALSN